MNYEQANSVKELAPVNYEILKELDVECYRCAGTGIKCYVCGGEKKIKWQWQPKVGEFLLTPTGIWLFTHKREKEFGIDFFWMRNEKGEGSYLTKWGMQNIATPILDWETIKEVLEKAGYRVDVDEVSRSKDYKYECVIIGEKSKLLADVYAESYQKAVMLATIELGREIK